MRAQAARSPWREIAGIVGVGLALGVAYNALGLVAQPPYGIAWIAQPRTLATLEGLAPASPGEQATLPEIPETPQPLQVQLPAVKRWFDQSAVVFVDARDRESYAAGHIPGAILMPYEEFVPEQAEALETGGRPVVTYCDGGACELSLNLAWDLLAAGHRRVLVFAGGFPEWKAAGYPVALGEEPWGEAQERGAVRSDDPFAFFGVPEGGIEIPESERPIEAEREVVKRLFDGGTALFLDAREPEEFAAGHIPGARNLPSGRWSRASLQGLAEPGRVIVAYCGGGACELSTDLAWKLVEAGYRRVLVYTGGFPDWEQAGYPVRRGAEEG